MRLTRRCRELLTMLRAARWLTTGQVHRRFFAQATVDAARKRLRRLTEAGYLVMVREHRMSEALFTLGREGKRVLERSGGEEITLEPRPPKQLEHWIGINDLRVAAELVGSLSYFFAYWELPRLGWRYPVIPDAVFSICNRTFAAEFDRGDETVRFFIKTKVACYRRGLEGLPLTAVLIVTDRMARAEALARQIPNERGRFLYTTIDLVRQHGLLAPIFRREADEEAAGPSPKSLLELS